MWLIFLLDRADGAYVWMPDSVEGDKDKKGRGKSFL